MVFKVDKATPKLGDERQGDTLQLAKLAFIREIVAINTLENKF